MRDRSGSLPDFVDKPYYIQRRNILGFWVDAFTFWQENPTSETPNEIYEIVRRYFRTIDDARKYIHDSKRKKDEVVEEIEV